LIGGLALALLELIIEKAFIKKVHMISLFNFFLILFLGGISLLGEKGVWFKLQPAFTGVGIALFISFQKWRKKSFFKEMINEMPQKSSMPEDIIAMIESHIAALFALYGLFMVFVAFQLPTGQWIFFKTIGFYITFFIFLLFEILFIRYKMKKRAEYALKKELLKRY